MSKWRQADHKQPISIILAAHETLRKKIVNAAQRIEFININIRLGNFIRCLVIILLLLHYSLLLLGVGFSL